MKKTTLLLALLLTFSCQCALFAQDYVSLTFNLNGQANASGVTTTFTPSGDFGDVTGAACALSCTLDNIKNQNGSGDLNVAGGIATNNAICPNTNIGQGGSATFKFTITGLPANLNYNKIGLVARTFNRGGANQDISKYYNLVLSSGVSDATLAGFYSFDGIEIKKATDVAFETEKIDGFSVDAEGNLVITLSIAKYGDDGGNYLGIKELIIYKKTEFVSTAHQTLTEKIETFEAQVENAEALGTEYVNSYVNASDITDARAALNAAKALEPAAITESDVTTLQNAIDALANAEKVQLTPGIYMFVYAKDGKGDGFAMYSDGEDLKWNAKQADRNNYYWQLIADGTGYKVKNGDGKYFAAAGENGGDNANDLYVRNESEAKNTTFEALGSNSNRFLISIAGNAAVHAAGHGGNSGNIVPYHNESSNNSTWRLALTSNYSAYTVSLVDAPEGCVITRTKSNVTETAINGGFFLTTADELDGELHATMIDGYASKVTVDNVAKTVTVTYKSIDGVTSDLNSAIIELNALVAPAVSGYYVNCYPQTAIDAAIAVIEEAEEKVWAGTATEADVTTVTEATAAFNAARIAFNNEGGLYRLKNVNRGRMLSVKVAGDDVNSMAADENALNNIVQLVPAATEGRFYVKLQGRGLTVPPAGAGKGGVVTIEEGNGHEFTVAGVTEGSPYFYFADAESTDQTYNCLHDDNNNDGEGKNVVGWGKDNTSSQWYLLPVEEISVSLNAVEGKSYATLCLPFNAELTSGNVTAYQGEMGATGDVINIQSITGGIAANEGVLLVSEEGAATATFNVANPAAAADFTGNVFEGTNVQITGASDMYVLNNGSYGVGFYVLNGTLAPNRAYIPKTSAASALTFNFGGETTGIGSVENGATDNAPVYDLGGRRVIKPAKGIYIVNGKKVYVK